MVEEIQRWTLGKMQNPIRGLLHGSAAVVSAVGLGFLIWKAWGNGAAMAGVLIFGISLIAMYTVSSLFHSVDWRARVQHWMQRADHSMIFLVVAGTITPLAIVTLEGWGLALFLSFVWSMAAVGITLKLTLRSPVTWLSVTMQVLMGWSAVVWFPTFLETHGWWGAWPVIAGGAAYMIGVVIYATQRPRLFPRVFAAHELFHVLVVTASAMHWIAVYRVIAA